MGLRRRLPIIRNVGNYNWFVVLYFKCIYEAVFATKQFCGDDDDNYDKGDKDDNNYDDGGGVSGSCLSSTG